MGTEAFAAVNIVMPFLMIFGAVGFHYGAGNKEELKGLLSKSLKITAVTGVVLTIAAITLARPMSLIFASHDKDLLSLTVKAFSIYSLSFLLAGYNIYTSSFFTALNNGGVSAGISFGRTLVFQIISVIALPAIFGAHGIWYAVASAELLALTVSVSCLILNKNKYGY